MLFPFWGECMGADSGNKSGRNSQEKERNQKQAFSYIILTIEFIIAIFISNTTIVGIIIFGDLIQTLTITRLAYKLTDNKYGHEIYANN